MLLTNQVHMLVGRIIADQRKAWLDRYYIDRRNRLCLRYIRAYDKCCRRGLAER
jgi:hypothetical protein